MDKYCWDSVTRVFLKAMDSKHAVKKRSQQCVQKKEGGISCDSNSTWF